MSEVVIRCRIHGPLVVTGPVTVIDHLGNPFRITSTKGNVALCRCGQSKQKPFCDGSHKACGFVAEDIAVQDEGASAAPPPSSPEQAG